MSFTAKSLICNTRSLAISMCVTAVTLSAWFAITARPVLAHPYCQPGTDCPPCQCETGGQCYQPLQCTDGGGSQCGEDGIWYPGCNE